MIPAVVLIGLDVYQIAENVPELRQSQDLVAHTIEVITETQALETAIRDTERGQRGFLITGMQPIWILTDRGWSRFPPSFQG